MARAKLPANAGNFTCSSQVKRSHTQFTCVTCSLPVNTGKFTCFETASTSRRIHANCLQAHVNLPEYHRHLTASFTCGTHANLPASAGKNTWNLQAKTLESQVKIPAKRRQKTCNSAQNYLQLQTICYHIAGKFTYKLQVSSLHHAGEVTCNLRALLSAIACILREVLAE